MVREHVPSEHELRGVARHSSNSLDMLESGGATQVTQLGLSEEGEDKPEKPQKPQKPQKP